MVARNKFLGLGLRRKYEEEAVVIISDIYSSKKSMHHIENRLKKDGFIIYNIHPKGSNTILQLAGSLNNQLNNIVLNHTKVHFVAHSVGCVVLERMLNMIHDRNFWLKIGRIVLIDFPDNNMELMNSFLPSKFENFIINLLLKTPKNSYRYHPSSLLDFPENKTLLIIGSEDVNFINNIESITNGKIFSTTIHTIKKPILKNEKTIEETSFFIRRIT